MSFPKSVSAKAPPIKTQGIKTKLVPFILSSIKWDESGKWIEPFLGSGVVLFNAQPKRALASDTNAHIIKLYQDIQRGVITPAIAKEFLEKEGDILLRDGDEHYYKVRERFNDTQSSLDFLFLSRACFNGVMRFNSKGKFNVPFCKKPERFRQAYVTKICNQIDWTSKIMKGKDWEFVCQDWSTTLDAALPNDFIYLDPPYFGRHTDYFNNWSEEDADELARKLNTVECGFAFSMWLKNKYRENTKIAEWFPTQRVLTKSHFYHVGSSESLRNEMDEGLVISPGYVADDVESITENVAQEAESQLSLV